MIALIQRVTGAKVVIDRQPVAEIGLGLLALIGIQRGDGVRAAGRLAERLLQYRVFADSEDRMNLDLRAVAGGLLLVPQFTLAADTRKGNRPGFSTAAEPVLGQQMFAALEAECRRQHPHVATGEFGADMQVSLTNDGPVTFWLEVPPDTGLSGE